VTTLSVRYRAASGRAQTILVAIAALMSAGLTLAALFSLLASESLAWTIGLALAAPLSWWIVSRTARAARARRAAIAGGRPALVADENGLCFLDWQGESQRLEWCEITGFRVHHIVGEGPWLHVQGTYPHAGIQPVRFALRDLDADGEQLLSDLERLRQACTLPDSRG
jgi:hypothetical protein